VVTPFSDESFEFLVFQGGRINQVMRLMASGIEVQTSGGAFARFIENDLLRPDEYEEFRRIASHLQWLNNNRKLFVRSLVFEETLIQDFRAVPRAEDVNNGFHKGLRWSQKADGNYELTRLMAGRVVVTNYDPMFLSDKQGFELNEIIRKNPRGFVYLDIRPDGPGGDFAMRGAIKLRSMYQILLFLARGINSVKEFDVAPDSRTGEVAYNPTSTLQINVTDTSPKDRLVSVYYDGHYYSVADTYWDRGSFAILNVLFQTAVGEIENVGIPITISKSRSRGRPIWRLTSIDPPQNVADHRPASRLGFLNFPQHPVAIEPINGALRLGVQKPGVQVEQQIGIAAGNRVDARHEQRRRRNEEAEIRIEDGPCGPFLSGCNDGIDVFGPRSQYAFNILFLMHDNRHGVGKHFRQHPLHRGCVGNGDPHGAHFSDLLECAKLLATMILDDQASRSVENGCGDGEPFRQIGPQRKQSHDHVAIARVDPLLRIQDGSNR
jgi:hypothetical protein